MENLPSRDLSPRGHLEIELSDEYVNSPIIRGLMDAVRWRQAYVRTQSGASSRHSFGAAQQLAALERQIAAERAGADGDRYSAAFDAEKNEMTYLKRYTAQLVGEPRERFEAGAEMMLNDLTQINQGLPQPPEA